MRSPKRRRVWWGVFLVLALSCPAASADERPNVLLITLDTLRADHLACYGYEKIRTPHLDRLAADGIRFEKAYTPVPLTLPAHAALFTGKYPMATGIHDFYGNRLSAEHPTLAALVHARGYATAAVVGAAVLHSGFGLDRGFDLYYDNFVFSPQNETTLDAVERPGDVVVDKALSWLGANHQRRFFVWIHLYDPHHPYRPPPPYSTLYPQRPYDGEIAFADAQVGRVLEFLREKNLYDRTAIVVAGDHGEGLGEHGEKTHGFFIYDSTRRVPLIFKLPAHWPVRRKEVTTPVSLIDVLPTVLRVVGLAVPPGVQGKNLLPLMQGGRDERREGIYAETFLPRLHFNWSELRSVQVGDYHFIDAPKPELYDLSRDPQEQENLFEQRRTFAKQLQQRLSHLVSKYSSGLDRGEKAPLDPVLVEKLRALGYVAASGGSMPTSRGRQLSDPKDRIQMYELITEAFAESQKQNYDASMAKLRATFAIEKDSPPVHYFLGRNYYHKQDFASAIREFAQVVRFRPDYPLAAYYLGLAYGGAGDWDQAITHLRQALAIEPTNFLAAFKLGGAYLKVGRTSEGAAAFERAATLHPNYAPAHIALGVVLLEQGQLDQAIQALRKGVELVPGDIRTRLTLAKALEAKGLHEEAQEERRKAQAFRSEGQ